MRLCGICALASLVTPAGLSMALHDIDITAALTTCVGHGRLPRHFMKHRRKGHSIMAEEIIAVGNGFWTSEVICGLQACSTLGHSVRS